MAPALRARQKPDPITGNKFCSERWPRLAKTGAVSRVAHGSLSDLINIACAMVCAGVI
jgi:hypothetical protein